MKDRLTLPQHPHTSTSAAGGARPALPAVLSIRVERILFYRDENGSWVLERIVKVWEKAGNVWRIIEN